MITIRSKGNFKNFENFAKRTKSKNLYRILDMFGRQGVAALSSATPKDTGKTAASWSYEVTINEQKSSVQWYNNNTIYGPNGPSVAILLQYGHATKNGAWVEGKDFINPAMKSIFDKMAEEIWKEVTK